MILAFNEPFCEIETMVMNDVEREHEPHFIVDLAHQQQQGEFALLDFKDISVKSEV